MEVKITPIVEDFIEPKYETKNSACVDLTAYFSAKDDLGNYILRIYNRDGLFDEPRSRRIAEDKERLVLSMGERALICTGFKCQLPEGYEMQIRPRSGLSLKNGLTIVNSPGTVDADYRGPVGVILLNTSRQPVYIKDHTRIAQAGLHKVEQMEFTITNELTETERGRDGFGHTGVDNENN